MSRPSVFSFARYLSAKRTVDDRALNHHVASTFRRELAAVDHLTCLELGGGIGTMVERLWENEYLPAAAYHLVDANPDNIAVAAARLAHLAPDAATSSGPQPGPVIHLRAAPRPDLDVHLHHADVFDFMDAHRDLTAFDVVIAHAFLDLVSVEPTLTRLVAGLHPGALVYFTINFDGATILQPGIDPAFDDLVEQVYHRTMDERLVDGQPSGDSHTGRHLYHAMQKTGIQVLDAGSSDWVVIPHSGSYPHDEAYFLHYIVHTLANALADHPLLDRQHFADWIATRHEQIERGELVYIAHQIDYLGRVHK